MFANQTFNVKRNAASKRHESHSLNQCSIKSATNTYVYHARAEEPSDAMPHVTDKLREAVQACDDDKANTRRCNFARFCEDSTVRPINGQIMN